MCTVTGVSKCVERRTSMSRLYTLFALPFVAGLAVAQTPCDQLKLSFPDAAIKSIEFIPAGPFAAPTGSLTPVSPDPSPAAAPGGRGGRGGPGGQAKGPAGGGRAAQPA